MFNETYHDSQLNAIRDYFQQLNKDGETEIDMQDAIIAWFTNGHAEKMREEFLEQAVAVGQ